MKPTRTWIVIADGSRAHILLYEGSGKGLSIVPGSDFRHASPPKREIYNRTAWLKSCASRCRIRLLSLV